MKDDIDDEQILKNMMLNLRPPRNVKRTPLNVLDIMEGSRKVERECNKETNEVIKVKENITKLTHELKAEGHKLSPIESFRSDPSFI